MKKIKLKRWHKWLIGIFSFLILLFIFRFPILRGIGNVLIYENELKKSEVMFVLSGGAYDRGLEGAKLFKMGYVSKVICTGENQLSDFKVIQSALLESDLTRLELLAQGVPDSAIEVIHKGTSTKEESDVILSYCKQHHIKSILILSSKFHTRRIKKTMKRKLENAGIRVIIRGAPSNQYNEKTWWQNEYGLLAVNNEYVKLVYYLFK